MLAAVSGDKTLVVGSSGHAHVKCVQWADVFSVNILDYDQVVLNCRVLTAEWLSSVKYDYFQKLRRLFCRLLESNGRIIALGILAQRGTGTPARAVGDDTYSWSPIDIGTVAEAGETITIKDPTFASYLARLERWEYWYRIPDQWLTREMADFFGSTANTHYAIDEEKIATNRYDKALATALTVKTRPASTYSEDSWSRVGPPIVVLPDIPELETREAVNLILEDLLGMPQETLPPEWAAQVSVPGIKELQDSITGYKEAIAEYESRIAAVAALVDEREWYKKLLYASGSELEQVFSKCLGQLGATVAPAQYSQEEFVFDFGGQRYLVECKGVSKSAARAHVNQLTTYVDEYQEREGSAGKGVLFVNAWRNDPPALRGKAETPVFHLTSLSAPHSSGLHLYRQSSSSTPFVGS